jgi:hypothetical protein
MKMGTAHKQNISVQHRIWNQNGTQKSEPVEFGYFCTTPPENVY